MVLRKSGDDTLIWDSESPYPTTDVTTLLWRGFAPSGSGVISIPQLIEENADVLRARYLSWIYELGELRISGQRLIDYLELRPGFSYWWTTLIVEKDNFSKSPLINDVIRFLAFEHWALGRTFQRITLASSNEALADCLRKWCLKSQVAFEWERLPKRPGSLRWVRRSFAVLPVALKGWVWLLKYLTDRWPLRGAGVAAWRNSHGSTTFVSYLFNLMPDTVSSGRHESQYWGNLPDMLLRQGSKSNWLHLYLPSSTLPNSRIAAQAIKAFNETGKATEIHVTLDSFLSVRILYHSIQDWIRLAWKGRKIQYSIAAAAKTGTDLWPLFSEDWRESTRGVTSMSNVLFASLFDAALKSLPEQKMGYYLQENQGWEFALIQSWRIRTRGKLIGVPHSTVRFWDLRYFFDPRSYQRVRRSMPLPDKVAVNGHAATDAYIKGGYPLKDLVQVEALRYLYLANLDERSKFSSTTCLTGSRLLVLGDYLESNTRRQMLLLAQSSGALPNDTLITVKPHPACPVHAKDYPELRLTITMEPLANLLPEADIVYTSAVTSAAVDAYCARVPVVSVLDPTMLNLSPLRGCEGVIYVSSSESLIGALRAVHLRELPLPPQSRFFNLNIALPLWRQLLTQCA